MPKFSIANLTPEAATRICQHQCRAGCCRGPLILRLTAEEVASFQERAAALGVSMKLRVAPDGGGWVRFDEQAGERCPMLHEKTFACRIYADRPGRCREFPERPMPGCAISGWDAPAD